MSGHHPPLAPWNVDAPHQVAHLGDLPLESGKEIESFEQSFVTHGALDSARSNAVLICSAITSNHHRLDFLIGPGKALDPERWFVVATDAIGNGLSTSPSNSATQSRMRFPPFSIRDMVSAQHRLLTEHLGISRLAAVVGASMGGMQALQWAVSHPRFMDRIVAMTPLARTPAWSIAVNEATRSCLMADTAWNGQEFTAVPTRGWSAWVNVQRVLVSRTPEALAEQFRDPVEVRAWMEMLRCQWMADGFDAHDFLYQSRAYDAHDVGATPGHRDVASALASVVARTLIFTAPLDLYNPVADGIAAASLIAGASHLQIPSTQGHQSASATSARAVAFLNDAIRAFMNDVVGPA